MTVRPIRFLKLMIVAYVSCATTCIAHARDDELHRLTDESQTRTKRSKFYFDPTINSVWYKPHECGTKRVSRQTTAKHSDEISKTYLHEDLTLPDEHSAYSDKFINMLAQLGSMMTGHPGLIKDTASYRTWSDGYPTNSLSCLPCRLKGENSRGKR